MNEGSDQRGGLGEVKRTKKALKVSLPGCDILAAQNGDVKRDEWYSEIG